MQDSIADALKGPESEKPVYDAARMLAAFPYDMLLDKTAMIRPCLSAEKSFFQLP
jgi:hypothetical protein